MAKRSRRPRRQDSERVVQPAAPVVPVPEISKPANGSASKNVAVDFAQEYFHVYQELRNLLIITVAMLVVMAGLAFTI